MSLKNGRYAAPSPPSLAEGWTLERLTSPSRLFGANGLRTGPDGRIYVAQVSGSQISAIDVGTGRLETISPMGSEIVAPDDVAFDPRGNLYVTEVMDARVSVLGVDGRSRVLRDDVPGANGITFHQGRLFIDECRMGGRLLELDLNGGAPRVLLENLPLPNALEAGPDGRLYFPLLGANEIWRVHPDGGAAERVVGDLGVPVAVKFDSKGYHRLAPGGVRRGAAHRSAQRRAPRARRAGSGSRQLDLRGRAAVRLELRRDGSPRSSPAARPETLLPGGLNWPLDLAMATTASSTSPTEPTSIGSRPAASCSPSGCSSVRAIRAIMRGLASARRAASFVVTTSGGQVALYRPAEQ